MTTAIANSRVAQASAAAYAACKSIESEDGINPDLKAYHKVGDIPTIGWGYAGKIRDKLTGQLRPIRLGDEITREEADMLFDMNAAPEAERRVDFFFPNIPLNQGQRDALFMFCYNLRWASIRDATLRTIVNGGKWDREELIEWWIKYRNPKTRFEEGLYRRRIAELCILFGCDHEIAQREAWEAELRRDPFTKEIIRQTDPELIIMRAETKTEAKKIAMEEIRKERLAKSRPAETVQDQPSPDTEQSKPVGATKPTEITVEPLPEIKPAPKPVVKKTLPGQPATTTTEDDVRKNPQFWTMVILVFGRVGVVAGFVPAAFTELITDKNFQVALAGIIAIYFAMFIAWEQNRSAEKKAQKRALLEDEEGAGDGLA
jgi:GH24 family phage-related lysozyme (muramidase)